MTIQGPAPATTTDNGDRLDWSTLVGSLLLIDVGSLEVGIVTQYGSADAVRCDVTNLDTGQVWENTLAWGTVLITQLTPRQGQKVCARLAYGTAKAGRSAPYILTDPTPAELAVAHGYVAQRHAPQAPAPLVPVVQNHPTPGGTSVYQLQQQAAAAKAGAPEPPF